MASEKRYVVEMKVFVLDESGERDPETIASEMDRGAERQLQGFPEGEVMGVDVGGIREADEEEQASYFEE